MLKTVENIHISDATTSFRLHFDGADVRADMEATLDQRYRRLRASAREEVGLLLAEEPSPELNDYPGILGRIRTD